MNNVQLLTDDELIILNTILVKEVTNLSRRLDNEPDSNTLKIGNASLKGLISMYNEYQQEIKLRGLV